jgi:hypothetical protein
MALTDERQRAARARDRELYAIQIAALDEVLGDIAAQVPPECGPPPRPGEA